MPQSRGSEKPSIEYGQVASARAAIIVEEINARESIQELEAKCFIILGAPEDLARIGDCYA